MEKFTQMRQRAAETTESTPAMPVPDDEVIAELHRCADPNAQCTPDDIKAIHEKYERCETFPLYDAYVNNRLPNFDHLERHVAALIENVPENLRDDPEAQTMIKRLQGRPLMLRGSVQSYVQSVIRFVNISKRPGAFGDDHTERLVKIDHERRRKHENLLRALTEFVTLLEQAKDYGLCEDNDYHLWLPGSTDELPEKLVTFSPLAIANRDFIKDWALAADFAEQEKRLARAVQQKE